MNPICALKDAFVRARSSKLCRWEIFIRREMYLISGVGYSEVFAVAFAVLAAGAIILTVNVLLLIHGEKLALCQKELLYDSHGYAGYEPISCCWFQTHLTLVIFIHNLIALQVQHLNCRAHYDWI
ncbi:hypothetical protein ACMD2_26041 [Ananas comosus]|uniref:Uncharacterized protein n=1 Tax=Ananas comosus TaxID=4615 RepID=A0A199VSN5_ANACO|nr:hypothetical protein ACMD2_26041 [Ananas comosus]